MFTFFVVLTVLVLIALVLVTGMKPRHSLYSMAEMKRRAKHSVQAKDALAREQLLPGVRSLLAIKGAVLLVLAIVLLIAAFGWLLGIVFGVIVALFYIPLSQTRQLSSLATKLYVYIEPSLLSFVYKFPTVFAFFSEAPEREDQKVHSKEEFQELIDRSGAALTDIERKVIINALDFNDTAVSTIMTPKSVIDFVKKGEFLGPLVLDELHSLGHSRLPVISEDLDHVVGILYLRDLLSLDVRRSALAEKVMDTHVYYIREDQTLEHALAAFLKNRHHMFIVINKQRETVGLLTIEDTIEALLGRKIVDEDDNHADLRSVAEHEGRYNNTPAGHINV